MKAKLIFGALLMASAVSTAAADEEWIVARSSTSGSCSLQLATSRPILGVVIATVVGEKPACESARDLKTDDITESSKCFTYTPNTIAFCAKRDVKLEK